MAQDLFKIEGLNGISKAIAEIPSNIRRNTVNAAARRIIKPAKREFASRIENAKYPNPVGKDKRKNRTGYSKLKALAKLARVVNIKAPGYGARVGLPVVGLPINDGSKSWNAGGLLKLLAAGAYKKGFKRKKTGVFTGFANFGKDVHDKYGNMMANQWEKEISREVIRAVVKRFAKLGGGLVR